MSDFVDTIFFHARHTPANPAVATLGTIASYGLLAQAILAVEEKVVAAGLKGGETVAILIQHPVGHFAVLCALYRLGITSVSIYPNQIEDLSQILVDAVLADEHSPAVPVRTIRVDEAWFRGSGVATVTPRLRPRSAPDLIARLILSSGTTGQPKIISLTYRAIQERLISYALRLGTPGWDRLVCVPSLNTNFGFCFVITTVWLGRMAIFAGDDYARAAITAYQADVLMASTQQIASIARSQEENYVRLDSLRSIHIGGSVAFGPLLTKIRVLLCDNVFCGYGSTEAGTVAYAPAARLQGFDRAVGIVAPWIDLQIVGEDNQEVPAGQEGRVRIRAYGQGHLYRRTSESEYEIDRGEWFEPGDRGIRYKNGMLIILGRTHDIINKGGVKVSPDLIEEIVKSHPAIADAAAVGVLNQIGLEQIWVGVVVEESADVELQELYAYCREKMATYPPDRIYMVPSIPRNALGKVVRGELRNQLARLEAEAVGYAPKPMPEA